MKNKVDPKIVDITSQKSISHKHLIPGKILCLDSVKIFDVTNLFNLREYSKRVSSRLDFLAEDKNLNKEPWEKIWFQAMRLEDDLNRLRNLAFKVEIAYFHETNVGRICRVYINETGLFKNSLPSVLHLASKKPDQKYCKGQLALALEESYYLFNENEVEILANVIIESYQ